ncbi:MAG: IclR family transcriptional regulator [Negativicutes bacterium]
MSEVQVLDRSLDIIEIVAATQHGLGISQIAEKSGLPKATAYRLITALCSRGYLQKEHGNTYQVGIKLIEVASYHINELELQTEVRPYLKEIVQQLNLTAHLGVLDQDKVVYVEKQDLFSRFGLYAQIGYRIPAYCSSMGKCLLSALPEDKLLESMRGCHFMKFTANTITDFKTLKQELQKVRGRGWAIDDQEERLGQRCVGAPIYDYRGEMIAAISASGNLETLPDEKIEKVSSYVMRIAREISRKIGYIA